MDYNKQVKDNINIIQRNIVALKDGIERHEVSKGQAKFLNTYMELINDYIKKCTEVLDVEKYKQLLEELDN